MANYKYDISLFLAEPNPTVLGLSNAVFAALGKKALVGIKSQGNTPESGSTIKSIDFDFDASLTAGEETTLNSLVSTYTNPVEIEKRRNFVLATDQPVTSTEGDVSGWTSIPLENGKFYQYSMIVTFSNSVASVAGPGIGLFFSAAPTNFGGLMYAMNTPTTDTDRALSADAVGANSTITTANQVLPLTVFGVFKSNASGGTVKIRSSCGGGTTTLYAGSVFTIERIP